MKAPRQFMIVDDDVVNNYLCESAIRVLFPESAVKLFTNPEEALQTIRLKYTGTGKQSIVMFLDINMPQMSGWTFLQRFADLPAGCREQFVIYMLTSSIDPHDKKLAGTHYAVTGFLSKPLIVKELRALFMG